MFLFKKISIPDSPGNKDKNDVPAYWYLILRTYEDVLAYMKIDAELFQQAMTALPASLTKSHLDGARESVIYQSLLTNAMLGQEIDPIGTTSKLVRDKAMNMIKMISEGKQVQVNERGGYSDHEGFLRVWPNYVIIEEIEKETSYFPSNEKVQESDIVFLENAERIDVDFSRDIYRKYNSSYDKKTVKITQLKERDPKMVFETLSKTKMIVFCTQIADRTQVDKMVDVFLKLSPKKFVIRTSYLEELKSHPKFVDFEKHHSVIFI